MQVHGIYCTALGKNWYGGTVGLDFCGCCKWKRGLWKDLDWGDHCLNMKWSKTIWQDFYWCVGWNHHRRIRDRLYIFKVYIESQHTKEKTESWEAKKKKKTSLKEEQRKLILTHFILSPIIPSPLWRAVREEALSAAPITRFIISGLTISIQTFSGFCLSAQHNLCAAKYYGCLQLTTL